MEGSVYYTRGVLRTNGDILWVNQLASNILSNDERVAKRLDQHKKGGGIYQQHYSKDRNGGEV